MSRGNLPEKTSIEGPRICTSTCTSDGSTRPEISPYRTELPSKRRAVIATALAPLTRSSSCSHPMVLRTALAQALWHAHGCPPRTTSSLRLPPSASSTGRPHCQSTGELWRTIIANMSTHRQNTFTHTLPHSRPFPFPYTHLHPITSENLTKTGPNPTKTFHLTPNPCSFAASITSSSNFTEHRKNNTPPLTHLIGTACVPVRRHASGHLGAQAMVEGAVSEHDCRSDATEGCGEDCNTSSGTAWCGRDKSGRGFKWGDRVERRGDRVALRGVGASGVLWTRRHGESQFERSLAFVFSSRLAFSAVDICKSVTVFTGTTVVKRKPKTASLHPNTCIFLPTHYNHVSIIYNTCRWYQVCVRKSVPQCVTALKSYSIYHRLHLRVLPFTRYDHIGFYCDGFRNVSIRVV